MNRGTRPMWQIPVTIAAAAIVVSVGITMASSLGRPVGQDPANPALPAESPTAQPTPAPSTAISPNLGMTEELAVAAARAAAPQAAEYPVIVAKAGSAEELLYAEGGYQIAPGLPRDRWVWVVILGDTRGPLDADGSIVVIDFIDGTIYEVVDWMS
jgi:hypothetical protein